MSFASGLPLDFKYVAEEGWKYNSGSNAQSAGSIFRPLLPSPLSHCSPSMGMSLVPRVLLSSKPCSCQEKISLSLPMLPLTREARDLQHFLQAAGDSSASPMHSNCDGRRCSLCADVKIKQGLVMRDAIHVMCTPELSSLISEGITSGGIW
jgi:hypothetical protein